jgi:hypothetical protein
MLAWYNNMRGYYNTRMDFGISIGVILLFVVTLSPFLLIGSPVLIGYFGFKILRRPVSALMRYLKSLVLNAMAITYIAVIILLLSLLPTIGIGIFLGGMNIVFEIYHDFTVFAIVCGLIFLCWGGLVLDTIRSIDFNKIFTVLLNGAK